MIGKWKKWRHRHIFFNTYYSYVSMFFLGFSLSKFLGDFILTPKTVCMNSAGLGFFFLSVSYLYFWNTTFPQNNSYAIPQCVKFFKREQIFMESHTVLLNHKRLKSTDFFCNSMSDGVKKKTQNKINNSIDF